MKGYEQIEAEILLRNNAPIADFENLSPNNFHYILNDAYNEKSPVHFQKHIDSETLDKVGLFRVAEDFIRIIERERFIKLTPLGALPKKVMVELYDKKYVLDDFIERGIVKLWKEQDCIAIQNTKMVTEIAGITKKRNGKMTLTKKGATFLQAESRQQFFELFLTTFADKFNWGFNDLFPQIPVGQVGWTFTIYLLEKYGHDFQSQSLYAEKYAKALPHILVAFEADKSLNYSGRFADCFRVRSFERFLEWFGLAETRNEGDKFIDKNIQIKRTGILTKVFNIDL